MKCPHCGGDGAVDGVTHLPQNVTATIKAGRVVGYDKLPDAPIMATGFNPDGTRVGVQPPLMDFPVPGVAESPLEAEARTKAAQRAADKRG